jgi:glycosyltransferase involved in cell wall biosynthesis
MPGDRPSNPPDLSNPSDLPESVPFPVAHVHWALPPVIGGVETYLADFARTLGERGHPVTVFTGDGELKGWPNVESVRLELLHLDRYDGRQSRAESLRLADELAGVMGKELELRGIDVVHGHNLHYFSPVPALALERLRVPLGLRLHHTYHSLWRVPDGKPADALLRTCHTWPGQHTASHYVRAECERALRVHSVQDYLGVAEDRYESVPALPEHVDEQVVLLPARLVPEKGAVLALRALRRLLDERLSVRLILTTPEQMVDWDHEGDGYKADVLRLIAELDLKQHVDFRSAQYDEMPDLYASADVVIYPSIYPEPLGIALLEAAAAGRPTIVTRIGGLKETVVDGTTGFIVAPGDLRALTDRLRTLLSDRELAQRMGAAGRERVSGRFGLNGHTDRMIAHYRSIGI